MSDYKKDNSYWKEVLDPETYHITREAGTEAPFSGKYNTFNKEGIYHCSNCEQELFSSQDKFDSGCGWPSFSAGINSENIRTRPDNSNGMNRVEILCARCDAHLGHVFEDGPTSTGQRFCVNSPSLKHQESSKEKK